MAVKQRLEARKAVKGRELERIPRVVFGGLVYFFAILLSCTTLSSGGASFRDMENRVVIRKATENQTSGFPRWFAGVSSDGRGPALSLRISMGDLESLIGEVELSSPLLPALRFRGNLALYGPAELLLQIHAVQIFDNWNNGWTEGEAEAFGTLIFRREYLRWWATLRDPLGIGEVKLGEVRFFDRYYRGEEGTRRVQTRIQRLLARVIQESSMEGDLKEKSDTDVEETPGLFLSLLNLSHINQQLGKEEFQFVPSEE